MYGSYMTDDRLKYVFGSMAIGVTLLYGVFESIKVLVIAVFALLAVDARAEQKKREDRLRRYSIQLFLLLICRFLCFIFNSIIVFSLFPCFNLVSQFHNRNSVILMHIFLFNFFFEYFHSLKNTFSFARERRISFFFDTHFDSQCISNCCFVSLIVFFCYCFLTFVWLQYWMLCLFPFLFAQLQGISESSDWGCCSIEGATEVHCARAGDDASGFPEERIKRTQIAVSWNTIPKALKSLFFRGEAWFILIHWISTRQIDGEFIIKMF